jgi:hypothetical protein
MPTRVETLEYRLLSGTDGLSGEPYGERARLPCVTNIDLAERRHCHNVIQSTILQCLVRRTIH